MDDVRNYIISVVTASAICSFSVCITGKMGTIGKIVKLISGIFLLLTLLSPIYQFPVINVTQYISDVNSDANLIVAQGQEILNAECTRIITERTEAYVLSKAEEMGVVLEVSITVSDVAPYEPMAITVAGNVSPFIKKKMQHIIVNDLGIQEENQMWI